MVLVDVITTHGVVGLKRLVSIPGWIVLAALAVPWWVMSAAAGGRQRFVHGVVLNDQLLAYFGREASGWPTIAEPIDCAATGMLPWRRPLRFALRRALRESDPGALQPVRLLHVGQATRC